MALKALHDLRTRISNAVLHPNGIHVTRSLRLYAFEIALPMLQVKLIVQLANRSNSLRSGSEIPRP